MSDEQEMAVPLTNKSGEQKFCHACATSIHVSASMCPKCGAQQNTAGARIGSPSSGSELAQHTGAQKYCHACATNIHASAIMCPKCGAQQNTGGAGIGNAFASSESAPRSINDQQYCRGCGKIIHASATTCPHCGAQQSAVAGASGISNGATKSRVTGALLAFFLGGFGVHKFYCGKIGLGFLYLIFCWTWIPALVALIEGVLFLTNTSTDEEFSRKYCI